MKNKTLAKKRRRRVIKNIYMKNRTLGKIKEKIDNYY